MVAGSAHVEHLRRNDPILFIIEDRWTDTSSVYIGKTPLFTTSTSEPLWQIERQTFDGSKIVTEFANHAKWNCIWDNRAAYFGAPGGVTFPGETVTGVLYPSGLRVAGKVTKMLIGNSTWVELPTTPLANRNAISIQNQSTQEIKINYDIGVATFEGMSIPPGGERFYDITDSISIYAKSASGNVDILVEEIS